MTEAQTGLNKFVTNMRKKMRVFVFFSGKQGTIIHVAKPMDEKTVDIYWKCNT